MIKCLKYAKKGIASTNLFMVATLVCQNCHLCTKNEVIYTIMHTTVVHDERDTMGLKNGVAL